MAEGTRLKEINDHVHAIEKRVQSVTLECNDKMDEKLQQFNLDCLKKFGVLAQQLDELQQESQQRYEALQIEAAKRHEVMLQENARRHEQLLKMFTTQSQPPNSQTSGYTSTSSASLTIKEGRQQDQNRARGSTNYNAREERGKGLLPNPHRLLERGEEHQGRFQHIPYPRLEFPTFQGEEPREWSSHCEQYFRIYQVPELQWVEIATMHFTGRAHRWKEGYLIDKPDITCEELVEAVCRRFDGSDLGRMIREFNKLTQTSTVERYQERFEELRTRMLYLNPTISERHFIESYISGLKEELVPFIDLSRPTTLEEVYEQAKLHERALGIIMRKSRVAYRAIGETPQGNSTHKTTSTVHQRSSNQPYRVSKQLFEQRRAAGLCYKCGEKYQPGHICQNRTLLQICASPVIDEIFDEQLIPAEEEDEEHPSNDEEVGEVEYRCTPSADRTFMTPLRCKAKLRVAREVKAEMVAATPLAVTVADGHKVMSKLKCASFQWTMQGEPYQAELRVIRLDGSSMILGIDWLRAYGQVTFDYSDNSVSFNKEGKQTVLKGIVEGSKERTFTAELKSISAKQWYKAGLEGRCCAIGQYCPTQLEKQESNIPPRVQEVLLQYEGVFQEPQGLPPQRGRDHKIPLHPGTIPAERGSIRPNLKKEYLVVRNKVGKRVRSGESRSLMNEIKHLVAINGLEFAPLKLMVVYKNSEKMLADVLGAAEGIKLFYHHHSASYNMAGCSVHKIYYLPSPATPEELENFLQSTDKSVLLLEFCGWTAKLMQKSKDGEYENSSASKISPYTTGEVNTKLDGKPELLSIDEKVMENEELDFGEAQVIGSPWVGEFALANQSALQQIENREADTKMTCMMEEFQLFESFYTKFVALAKNIFCPLRGCPTCSMIVKEGDRLRIVLQSHPPLIKELEVDGHNVDATFPADGPSIVLIVDRSSESSIIRGERKFAWQNQLSYQMFEGLHNNSSLIPFRAPRGSSSKSKARLDSLVPKIMKIRIMWLISLLAKEVGFPLLSKDFEVRVADSLPTREGNGESDVVIEGAVTSSKDQTPKILGENFDNNTSPEDGDQEDTIDKAQHTDTDLISNILDETSARYIGRKDSETDKTGMLKDKKSDVIDLENNPHQIQEVPSDEDKLADTVEEDIKEDNVDNVEGNLDIPKEAARMELVVREVYRAFKNYMTVSTVRAKNIDPLHIEDNSGESLLRSPIVYLMDCTLNDCSTFLRPIGEELYPAFVLYPAENKTAIVYEGDLSVINIMEFLESHGGNSHYLTKHKGFLWTHA
uniref:Ty3 transposon capsid-like protein domain-containing protein n=1 Tax=Ananas comosus var. bracteatus TaxID=296719 RepID=A0A6V7PYA9_ANACO|nr:unnamed protein product [Ananas comosus var. bracteatus]